MQNHGMAHRPEPPASSNVTLQIGPGHPGQAELDVRVSPEHVEELRECLESEGLRVSNVMEFSAGGWLDVLAVSLTGGGAVTVAITKFLGRHQGKKVTFGSEGQVETMEGFSAREVERVLGVVAQRQREIDLAWKRIKQRPNDQASSGDTNT